MLRLFGYYAVHTVWNTIKKIFKTKALAIVIILCVAFGAIIGGVAAALSNLNDAQNEKAEITAEMQEDALETLEEVTDLDLDELVDLNKVTGMVEMVMGLVLLAVFFFEIMSGDKNGASIFTMADVNILFPSPMVPQSILMFKLLTQLGISLFAGLYMIFQIPNLVLNAHVPLALAIMLLVIYILMLFYGKIMQVLVYTICSTKEKLKQYIRPVCYVLIFLIAGGFLLFYKSGSLSLSDALIEYFNKPFTRYIPIWGWMKALPMYVYEQNTIGIIWSSLALLIGAIVITWSIWQFKADFYEDALKKSSEVAEKVELQKAAAEGGTAVVAKRKKDRSDKLERDGFNKGNGANVFFWKSFYNRFRFAHLHFFTKTMEFNIAATVLLALLLKMAFHYEELFVIGLMFVVIAFFRALSDPLMIDCENPIFLMVPENPYKKVFFSILGGAFDSFMDTIVPMLIGCIILQGNPIHALLWTLIAVTIDLYSTCANMFLTLALPTSCPQTFKTLIVILFIYFGLLPPGIILIIGIIVKKIIFFATLTVLANIFLAGVFYGVSPLFLLRGRK